MRIIQAGLFLAFMAMYAHQLCVVVCPLCLDWQSAVVSHNKHSSKNKAKTTSILHNFPTFKVFLIVGQQSLGAVKLPAVN